MTKVCCKKGRGLTIGKLYKIHPVGVMHGRESCYVINDHGNMEFFSIDFFCTKKKWRIIEINKIIDNGNDLL